MEHPFWITAFVITDPADIEAILASSIKEVWIDSSKGLDVQQGEHVITTVESEAQIEADLNLTAQAIRQKSPVSVATEIERATKICAQSRRAVTSMFNEARIGNAVNTSAAQKLVEGISDSISRNAGALISLARLKTADDYTYMHSVAVCALMIALSKQLGLDKKQTRTTGWHRRFAA